MTSLIFQELPPGPVPLFIGEPGDKVPESGTLLLDHVGRTVSFVQADPFQAHSVPAHSAQRFTRWEIDAMLPRWQLRNLYGEVRPLLERIQMGTSMTRLPTHWDRTQTPEAVAAVALVDDLAAQPAEAAVEWVASPRPVRAETALERAIRLSAGQPMRVDGWEAMRGLDSKSVQFLMSVAEKEFFGREVSPEERRLRNRIAHGLPSTAAGNHDLRGLSGSPVFEMEPGSVGMSETISFLHSMATPPKMTSTLTNNLQRAFQGNPIDQRMARKVKSALASLESNRKYSRKGVNGKWGTLFEESDFRKMTG